MLASCTELRLCGSSSLRQPPLLRLWTLKLFKEAWRRRKISQFEVLESNWFLALIIRICRSLHRLKAASLASHWTNGTLALRILSFPELGSLLIHLGLRQRSKPPSAPLSSRPFQDELAFSPKRNRKSLEISEQPKPLPFANAKSLRRDAAIRGAAHPRSREIQQTQSLEMLICSGWLEENLPPMIMNIIHRKWKQPQTVNCLTRLPHWGKLTEREPSH